MRINQKMRDAASKALGYEVDSERILEAFGDQEEDFPLDKAKKALKKAEVVFSASGGRGVDLADEIDNLRIYVAALPHVNPSKRIVQITLNVEAPDDMTEDNIRSAIQNIWDSGVEDARLSKDADFHDDNIDDVLALNLLD